MSPCSDPAAPGQGQGQRAGVCQELPLRLWPHASARLASPVPLPTVWGAPSANGGGTCPARALLLRRCARCGRDPPLPLRRHLLVGASAAGGSEPQPTAAATARHGHSHGVLSSGGTGEPTAPQGPGYGRGSRVGHRGAQPCGGGSCAALGGHAHPAALAGASGSRGPAPHRRWQGRGPGTGTPVGGCPRRRHPHGREGTVATGQPGQPRWPRPSLAVLKFHALTEKPPGRIPDRGDSSPAGRDDFASPVNPLQPSRRKGQRVPPSPRRHQRPRWGDGAALSPTGSAGRAGRAGRAGGSGGWELLGSGAVGAKCGIASPAPTLPALPATGTQRGPLPRPGAVGGRSLPPRAHGTDLSRKGVRGQPGGRVPDSSSGFNNSKSMDARFRQSKLPRRWLPCRAEAARMGPPTPTCVSQR